MPLGCALRPALTQRSAALGLAFFTFAIVLGALPCGAATRRVPLEYATIQAAITASSPGDSVLVGPGLYQENLDTQGKRVTLVSEAGASVTVVDGGRLGSVVRMTGGGVVEGFTLRNGQAFEGGGIYFQDVDGIVIRNNVIERNLAGFQFDSGVGGGLTIRNSRNVLVEGNTIRDNYAGDSGGGIYENCYSTYGFTVDIRRNVIASNGCHVSGAGALIYQSYTGGTFSENLVLNNVSDSFGAGIDGSGGVFESNTVVGNSRGGVILGNATVIRNLVVHNRERGLLFFNGRLECNDSWGNDINYEIYNSDTTGLRNVSLDPRFCYEAGGQFTLSAGSPCAPENSQGCGLIGAYPVACTVVPTRRETWGSLKVRYR